MMNELIAMLNASREDVSWAFYPQTDNATATIRLPITEQLDFNGDDSGDLMNLMNWLAANCLTQEHYYHKVLGMTTLFILRDCWVYVD